MRDHIYSIFLLQLASAQQYFDYDNTLTEEPNIKSGARVVDGKEVKIEDYPFAVRIERYYKDMWMPMCTGTILTKTVILTACHCLTDDEAASGFAKPEHVRITAGVTDFKDFKHGDGQVRVARNLQPHPKCRMMMDVDCNAMKTYENDVAFIRLKKPLRITHYVRRVNMIIKRQEARKEMEKLIRKRTTCQSVGWGYSVPFSGNMSNMLKLSEPQLIPNDECRERKGNRRLFFKSYSFCRKNQVCAVDKKSTLCQGDSGGPLICNGNLFGVTSYSENGCLLDKPVVFSNINLILDLPVQLVARKKRKAYDMGGRRFLGGSRRTDGRCLNKAYDMGGRRFGRRPSRTIVPVGTRPDTKSYTLPLGLLQTRTRYIMRRVWQIGPLTRPSPSVALSRDI